ncbi:MAG: D-cysteine desulfhydrase family protein [Candidatus Firestonebacteria bacterium]|nr:D-cysteine desulfhydrase family protein [Candidatus Firestonebacteria bacterium]
MKKQLKKLFLFNRTTPVEYLERLTKQLAGPKIFIKRDDLTDVALGGNKVRKLEYILADALEKKCDTIITTGGPQSNHARITAGVCAKLGLRCVLLLSGNKKELLEGNLLLDKIFGAEIRFADSWDFEKIHLMMEELAKHLALNGHKAYTIPVGGASGLGTIGYAECFSEILEQEKALKVEFSRIVTANGSGGTQAGLEIGKAEHKSKKEILGMSVLFKKEKALEYVKKEIALGYEVLGKDLSLNPGIIIDDSYLGEGYAIPDQRVLETIGLLGRTEGIILDPVYTGKAFGGLIDYIKLGKINTSENVLFVHTGGYPGIVNMTERHKKYFENI